jgi:hypothetical protein
LSQKHLFYRVSVLKAKLPTLVTPATAVTTDASSMQLVLHCRTLLRVLRAAQLLRFALPGLSSMIFWATTIDCMGETCPPNKVFEYFCKLLGCRATQHFHRSEAGMSAYPAFIHKSMEV